MINYGDKVCELFKPKTINNLVEALTRPSDICIIGKFSSRQLEINFPTCSSTRVRKRRGKTKEKGDGVGSRGGRVW